MHPYVGVCISDHKRITSEVQAIQAEVRKRNSRFHGIDRACKSMTKFRNDLVDHFNREEVHLYAAARRMGSDQPNFSIVQDFLDNESAYDLKGHHYMIELADQILALMHSDPASVKIDALMDRLATILARHARGEDTTIFPVLAETMSAEELVAP